MLLFLLLIFIICHSQTIQPMFTTPQNKIPVKLESLWIILFGVVAFVVLQP